MVNSESELHPRHLRRDGPHGLGDPEDKSLRKVEVEVMIPKKMRDKARTEKCGAEVEEFNNCCIENGMSMVYKCRKENDKMKCCLAKWYNDEEFKNICKDEYLQERSDYRRTGIGVKYKNKMLS